MTELAKGRLAIIPSENPHLPGFRCHLIEADVREPGGHVVAAYDCPAEWAERLAACWNAFEDAGISRPEGLPDLVALLDAHEAQLPASIVTQLNLMKLARAGGEGS